MYLVPFISNRWEQLPSSRGTDDQLRIALETLFDPRQPTSNVERTLDTVNDLIFHQQSTYPSTYITVPYLVQYMDRLDIRSQHQIVDLVTWIFTQRPSYGPLNATEIAAYYEAIERLEPKAEQLLVADGNSSQWRDMWNSLNLLGRLATLRGLKTVGTYLRHGEEETDFTCQHCDQCLQSRGPAVTYDPSRDPNQFLLGYSEPFEVQYILPLRRVVIADGNRDDPTTIYPRNTFGNFEPDHPAFLVNQWAKAAGHHKIATWLSHFFGFAHCPNCGWKNDLVNRLLDS